MTVKEKSVMSNRHARKALWVCLLLLLTVGCAPVTYEKKAVELYWPSPPDEPRVKFVDIIRSTLDLPRKMGMASAIFGEERIENFNKPYGVAVDREGKIYITDVGMVFIFDLQQGSFSLLGTDPGVGQLRVPIGIAAASDGRVFVTDVAADKVYIYKNAKYSSVIGKAGDLESPSGVALDEKNRLIYVVDARKHQVMIYSLDDYRFIRKIGTRGTGNGEFNFPTNIAVDRKGHVYVVDTGNFRVQAFDPEGAFLRSFGKAGDSPGSLARPKGIAIDSEGHLYVVDAAFSNFQVFDTEGRLLLFVGEGGSGPGKFQLPAGIAVDNNDKIYVVDQLPGSFQIFQYMGEAWKKTQK